MHDKVRWLHVSDFHLKRQSASWSQDVVLRALHKAIADCRGTRPVDFLLATGDLSYSGKRKEFRQVESFFDTLLKDVGLSHGDLFVVPGNHDNDLSVQKYSVVGARTMLTSSGLADDLMGDAIERDQILIRQKAYREFVRRFFPGGQGRMTPDGLGYVATRTYAPLRITVIGLNSAWLCLSGRKDDRQVIVGERQVIDAIRVIEEERPHLVIALIHHPMSWLRHFEQEAIPNRLRQVCDFVLRGHLHETEIEMHIAGDRKCMFVAAGASFETREFRNSFNYVELDIGQGTCTIIPFDYMPGTGKFVETAPQTSALAFRHLPKPQAPDLVAAILQVAPELSAIGAYLACLLRGDKSEFLAFDDGRPVFLALDALEADGASALVTLTRSFMSVGNLCTLAEGPTDLRATLTRYRDRLCEYGLRLLELAESSSDVRDALAGRNKEAKTYIARGSATGPHYTLSTLRDLRRSNEVTMLQQVASRNADDPNPEVRRESLRGLAFVQARSSIQAEREQALTWLNDLCDSPQREAEDFAVLISLLIDLDQPEVAKQRIRTAISTFPEKIDGLADIAMRLVQMTGDRAFRDELMQRQPARGVQS